MAMMSTFRMADVEKIEAMLADGKTVDVEWKDGATGKMNRETVMSVRWDGLVFTTGSCIFTGIDMLKGIREMRDTEIKGMAPAKGYVYSDSLGEMVIKSFIYKGERFDWNDRDCLYYSEYTDEKWFEDIPVSADSTFLTILE